MGSITHTHPGKSAQVSVTYAREHLFERSAVESGRSILTAALDRGMGEANFLSGSAGVRPQSAVG
jgi:hypothetical protein